MRLRAVAKPFGGRRERLGVDVAERRYFEIRRLLERREELTAPVRQPDEREPGLVVRAENLRFGGRGLQRGKSEPQRRGRCLNEFASVGHLRISLI